MTTPEEDKYTGELGLARRLAIMFLYGGLIFAAVIGLFVYYGSDRGRLADIEPAAGPSPMPERAFDYEGRYTQ